MPENVPNYRPILVHGVRKYVISFNIDQRILVSRRNVHMYVEGMKEHILGALYLSHFHFEVHFFVS